jgi:hypothetical protein
MKTTPGSYNELKGEIPGNEYVCGNQILVVGSGVLLKRSFLRKYNYEQ